MTATATKRRETHIRPKPHHMIRTVSPPCGTFELGLSAPVSWPQLLKLQSRLRTDRAISVRDAASVQYRNFCVRITICPSAQTVGPVESVVAHRVSMAPKPNRAGHP